MSTLAATGQGLVNRMSELIVSEAWDNARCSDGRRVSDIAMETGTASRGHAELSVQEAKYRTLFTSIDAGFCIVELKF